MLYGFIGKIKGGFMLKTIGNEGENLEQLIAETAHEKTCYEVGRVVHNSSGAT